MLNSSTSGGTLALEATTCSRCSQVAMFTTNSPVCSMLETVSFSPCAVRPQLAYITKVGFVATRLKKLYGARLTTPAALMLLIHPIGRGTTQLLIGSWAKPWSFFDVS